MEKNKAFTPFYYAHNGFMIIHNSASDLKVITIFFVSKFDYFDSMIVILYQKVNPLWSHSFLFFFFFRSQGFSVQ